jgi:hypothetical protein
MKKSALVLSVAVLLFGSAAFAANTGAVNGTAALEGSYGYEINFDGSTNRVYVVSQHPSGETTYRAEFKMKMAAGFTMTGPDNHAILLARQTAGGLSPWRLTMGRFRDGRYFVRAFFLQDNSNYRFIGGTIITVGPTFTIGVEWTTGNGDGTFKLLRNGTVMKEYLTCDNDLYVVDEVRFGAVAWIDPATNGSVYFDSFVSTR